MSRRGVSATATGVVLAAVALLLVGCGPEQRRDREPQRDQARRYERLTDAVADAMKVEDPLVRAARLATALQGFDRDALGEIQQAWLLAAGEVRGSQTVELALLADWWGRYDPEGAFTWLHERRRQGNPVLLTAIVRSWATRAPIAASRAVDALPPRRGHDSLQVVLALVQGWNASGHSGVEEYVIGLTSEVTRQVALTGLASDKAQRHGVDEAIRWAESLPDDAERDFKQLAFRRVAGAIAEVDPLRAAAWAERHRDGRWGTGLARSVAQKWSSRDGQSAMEWLQGLPDSGSSDVARAFEEGYRAWLNSDREAARAWLREQPLDATLDPVIAIYARSMAREDPEAALPWAARLHDEARRDETLEKVARAWMHRDPDAARAWLATSELSDAARERVFTAYEKGKAKAAMKRPSRAAAAN